MSGDKSCLCDMRLFPPAPLVWAPQFRRAAIVIDHNIYGLRLRLAPCRGAGGLEAESVWPATR